MHLVLASGSPSRLGLLRMAGIEPEVLVSAVDEDALTAVWAKHGPEVVVRLLASAKATAIVDRLFREGRGLEPLMVLGCDSMFEFDGEVYGKPHEPAVARERWRAMRGRSGRLHTGHFLIVLGEPPDHGLPSTSAAVTTSTDLDFADVSDAEIDWYVDSGEPLEVAGAFTLEGLAAPFITRIDGDPHSVVGLSLAALRELALELGHDWTELVAG